MKATIDASSLLAIYLDEIDAPELLRRIADYPTRIMTPVNYWEALIRASVEHGEDGFARMNALIDFLDITIVPVAREHAKVAAAAAVRFGRPSKARLNLGDCFAYALAVSEKAPLIFKGNDFIHTDVPV